MDIPLGGFDVTDNWSLGNLMSALVSLFIAIGLALHHIAGLRRSRKRVQTGFTDAGDPVEEPRAAKRWQTLRWLCIAMGVLTFILFLGLDSLTLSLSLINIYTPLFLALLALQLVGLAAFALRGRVVKTRKPVTDADL